MSEIGAWRADVQRDFRTFGLAVNMWRRRDDGSVDLMEPHDPVFRTYQQSDPELAAVREPSLRLDPEQAHALLDALAAYFGGTSDVQRLHADLRSERARVDKMIDHLIRPV